MTDQLPPKRVELHSTEYSLPNIDGQLRALAGAAFGHFRLIALSGVRRHGERGRNELRARYRQDRHDRHGISREDRQVRLLLEQLSGSSCEFAREVQSMTYKVIWRQWR